MVTPVRRESVESRVARWRINLFPAFRRTGARVSFVAADFHEVRVRLKLNWQTRNLVGTTFGGSLYGAVDPFYMLMLIRILGPEYVVWDKAATIRFRRPGRTTLFGTFRLDPSEIDTIRSLLRREPKIDRVYPARLVDRIGVVHAEFEKTVNIRLRKSIES